MYVFFGLRLVYANYFTQVIEFFMVLHVDQ